MRQMSMDSPPCTWPLKMATLRFHFKEFRNCGFIVDQMSSSGCGGAFGGRGQVGPTGVRQLPAALAHGHQQGSSGENPPWVHNGLHMLPHNFCLRESIHGLNMTHPGTHCDCQTADWEGSKAGRKVLRMYFKTCRNFIMAAGADAHENTFSFGTFVDAGHIFIDAF